MEVTVQIDEYIQQSSSVKRKLGFFHKVKAETRYIMVNAAAAPLETSLIYLRPAI